ncbi:MAG: hypothetical protein ACLSA2_08015 [Candidatus Gastranaerophilaceae bacterium]
MEEFYLEKLRIIQNHATTLNSYLHVLKTYAEYEMTESTEVGNIYEILLLAVTEIDNIMHNV